LKKEIVCFNDLQFVIEIRKEMYAQNMSKLVISLYKNLKYFYFFLQLRNYFI